MNIASLSSPVPPQRLCDALEMPGRSGDGGDHYGDYDFEDFEDTGYSQQNPFEVTNNPHQTAQVSAHTLIAVSDPRSWQ